MAPKNRLFNFRAANLRGSSFSLRGLVGWRWPHVIALPSHSKQRFSFVGAAHPLQFARTPEDFISGAPFIEHARRQAGLTHLLWHGRSSPCFGPIVSGARGPKAGCAKFVKCPFPTAEFVHTQGIPSAGAIHAEQTALHGKHEFCFAPRRPMDRPGRWQVGSRDHAAVRPQHMVQARPSKVLSHSQATPCFSVLGPPIASAVPFQALCLKVTPV
jgi:hypothetical protein